MTTQLITASYNDNFPVSFTSDAWFNATAVGNNFNKDVRFWLRIRETAEYVSAIADFLNKSNCDFLTQFSKIIELDGESSASKTKLLHLVKQTGLVKTKTGSMENGGGTWLHPKLAIAFARWLDVKFSIWCDMQIEKILHPVPYGLKALPTEPLRKTTKALPGCLSLETQDEIKQLIQDRAAVLPRERQASFVISMWSALGTHFEVKKEKGDKIPAYKHIPEGARLECLSLIARLSVDNLVTLTVEEFDAIKALPAPEAKEGNAIPHVRHDTAMLANDPFLTDHAYRHEARVAINAHLDACHADMKQAGVTPPEWPTMSEQTITGLAASLLWQSRWLLSFNPDNMKPQLTPMQAGVLPLTEAQWVRHMTQERGYVVVKKSELLDKLSV